MGKKLRSFGHSLLNHKSWLLTVLFVVIVGVLDSNSLLRHIEIVKKNAELRDEIAKYDEYCKQSQHELQLLKSSSSALEEVARVRLLMKTDEEDVYVIEE